jgi:uncharacterized protein YndB with AHSA1/START domain
MANTVVSRVENERFLILERVFIAPRDLVFKMHKDPEYLKHWWGPRGWELPVCRMDFRVGGTWLYCMKCVDKNQGKYFGMEAWGKAVYREINEPERIVYTDYFCDADGKVNDALPSTNVETKLIDLGDGKTKLVSRGEYATPEALKTVIDMGMLQGISESWDRMEERLESVANRS